MKKIVRLTESDLARIVKRVIKENSLLTEGVPNTTLTAPTPISIAARTVCGTIDFIKGSVILENKGTEDAYINLRPTLKLPSGLVTSQQIYTLNEFNVTIGGKPVVGQADGQNQLKVPKGKKATLNFVISTDLRTIKSDFDRAMTEMQNMRTTQQRTEASNAAKKKRDDSYNAIKNFNSATLLVRYNGQPLEIPMTFGGFMIDSTRACDAPIALPKGF